LIDRNGERYYGGPSSREDWSGYREIMDMLERILREMKQHIDNFIAKKFKQGQLIRASLQHGAYATSECLSLPRKICVVIPSFLQGKVQTGFKDIVLTGFREGSEENTVSFINQPQVDLAWYTFKSKLEVNKGDLIVFCQAEEDITLRHLSIICYQRTDQLQTISRFQVDDRAKSLLIHSQEIIPVASSTIGELLFGFVIQNIFPVALDDLYLFDPEPFADWLYKVCCPSYQEL
jgi:hypothetical protein